MNKRKKKPQNCWKEKNFMKCIYFLNLFRTIKMLKTNTKVHVKNKVTRKISWYAIQIIHYFFFCNLEINFVWFFFYFIISLSLFVRLRIVYIVKYSVISIHNLYIKFVIFDFFLVNIKSYIIDSSLGLNFCLLDRIIKEINTRTDGWNMQGIYIYSIIFYFQ